MPSDAPLILLTNDDGVHAAGLIALRRAAQPHGRVVVVAPAHEQSGASHSITIDRPLRHVEYGEDLHSISGTPADCIYLASFEPRFLGGRRPDLVISGINHGYNVGTSVFYSGTVAGAREGAMRGLPAIAFSAHYRADMEAVAAIASGMIARMLASTQPPGPAVLLNVNVPEGTVRGARVTRLSRQLYAEEVVARRDPGGREYFWIGGKLTDDGQVEDSDAQAVRDGLVSITPLELEVTKPEHLAMAAQVAGQDLLHEA
jgi:5'-nucleotidase